MKENFLPAACNLDLLYRVFFSKAWPRYFLPLQPNPICHILDVNTIGIIVIIIIIINSKVAKNRLFFVLVLFWMSGILIPELGNCKYGIPFPSLRFFAIGFNLQFHYPICWPFPSCWDFGDTSIWLLNKLTNIWRFKRWSYL